MQYLLFHYPIDLHYSQTWNKIIPHKGVFHYPIDLHYSQTSDYIDTAEAGFHYPIDLHYSQTSNLKLEKTTCYRREIYRDYSKLT